MAIPYVGFGNEKLDKLPIVKEGDRVECVRCGKDHQLESGTVKGEKSNLLLFYKCGKRLYLGALDGRLMVGVKSCCSGEI